MIPEAHHAEALRRRAARELGKTEPWTKEQREQHLDWLRKMKQQSQALMGMHELWNEMTHVVNSAVPSPRYTLTEWALVLKGVNMVRHEIVEKHARWREEEHDAQAR